MLKFQKQYDQGSYDFYVLKQETLAVNCLKEEIIPNCGWLDFSKREDTLGGREE